MRVMQTVVGYGQDSFVPNRLLLLPFVVSCFVKCVITEFHRIMPLNEDIASCKLGKNASLMRQILSHEFQRQ